MKEMGYTLSSVCEDKNLRKTLCEGHCYFNDKNGLFCELDFMNQSMRLNHRAVFDLIAVIGGTDALDWVLRAENTNLTQDPQAANVGVVAVRGVDGYYIKTNAGAMAAFTSILNAILAYGDFAEDFDLDLVTLSAEDEDGGWSIEPLEWDAEDESVDLELARRNAFSQWTNRFDPPTVSFVTKNGLHCFYNEDEERFMTLNVPVAMGDDAPTNPLNNVVEYEALTWNSAWLPRKVDEDGNELFRPLSKLEFTFGYRFRLKEGGKWGFINRDWQTVSPVMFHRLALTPQGDLCAFVDGCNEAAYRYRFDTGTLVPVENTPDGTTKFSIISYSCYKEYALHGYREYTAEDSVICTDAAGVYATYQDDRNGCKFSIHYDAPLLKITQLWEDSGESRFLVRRGVKSIIEDFRLSWFDQAQPQFTLDGTFGTYLCSHWGKDYFTRKDYDSAKVGVFYLEGGEESVLFLCDYQDVYCPDKDSTLLFLNKEGYWGGFDINGSEFILPFAFTDIAVAEELEERLVIEQMGKKGRYWVERGCYILPCEFSEIEWDEQRQNYIVTRNGLKGLCDRDGEQTIPCEFSELEWKESWKKYVVTHNGLKGLYNKEKESVIPCAFSALKKAEKWEDFYVTQFGKVGVCEENGRQIIPCDFDEITIEGEDYHVTKMGAKGVLDKHGKWERPLG